MKGLETMEKAVFREIPISDVSESPLNPRRGFDKGALEELTRSVKDKGVLQPILVRPKGTGYEVIAGARRLRATELAGLATIPARVVMMSDEAALEVMVIENLQRADVHPLEEAQGYQALMERRPDYDVPALAAKVGKSEGYIYQRLQLLKLAPAVRKAFLKDAVTPSLALLLARIPASLQAEALEDVGHLSTARAREEIQRQFMLELGNAEFETADPALVPKAGPCTKCPKRTGNQRALFDDVKSPDLCTDPPCFAAKRTAAAKQKLADARARGLRVLDEKQAQSAAYMRLDEKTYLGGMGGKSPRQILGKKLGDVDVAAALVSRHGDDSDPQYVELVGRKTVEKALRDLAKSGKVKDPMAAHRQEEAKRKAARALSRAVTTEALQQLREKLLVAPISMDTDALVSFIARHVGSDTYDEAFLERHGAAELRRGMRRELPNGLVWASAVVERLGTHAKLAFAIDALLTKAVNCWGGADEYDRTLVSACKVWGVDLEALERVERDRRAKKERAA